MTTTSKQMYVIKNRNSGRYFLNPFKGYTSGKAFATRYRWNGTAFVNHMGHAAPFSKDNTVLIPVNQ